MSSRASAWPQLAFLMVERRKSTGATEVGGVWRHEPMARSNHAIAGKETELGENCENCW